MNRASDSDRYRYGVKRFAHGERGVWNVTGQLRPDYVLVRVLIGQVCAHS